MAFGAKDRDIKLERRQKLDGGLNTRANPLNVGPDQCIAIADVRLSETGSAIVRKFAQQLVQDFYSTGGTNPWTVNAGVADAIVFTPSTTGGSLPAADYEITVFATRGSFNANDYSFSTLQGFTTVTVGGAGAGSITIDIFPNNSGEQAGQTAAGSDDPFNGGILGPVSSTGATVYKILVRKVPDANRTQQTVVFAWNDTVRAQRAVFTTYAVGAAQPASSGARLPYRWIGWHPGLQQLVAINTDYAQIIGTPTFGQSSTGDCGLALDKNGRKVRFSRLPTRIYSAYVNDILVLADGIGRPRRLDVQASVTTSAFRLVGAIAPTAAPTTVGTGAGTAPLAGTYKYLVTNVYRDRRGDGSTVDIESNGSPISTPLVLGVAQNVTVTLPAVAGDSGLQFRRVYRTTAGGSTFFKVGDAAAGAGTFTDTVTDASLGTATPPDAPGKTPNDIPPNRIYYITEHLKKVWGVIGTWLIADGGAGTDSRIRQVIGSNVLAFTKDAAVGTSEDVNAWPAINRVICGDARPITNIQSVRALLYAFKVESIGVVSGTDLTNFGHDTILSGVGALAHSVLQLAGVIYFWDFARAGLSLDGSRLDHVGYDIQDTWRVDRAAGFYPWHVYFDPDFNEIHWIMTSLDLTSPEVINNSTGIKEYVFHLPTRSWSLNTSTGPGTFAPPRFIQSSALAIRTADYARQVPTLFTSNANNQLLTENGQTDTDGVTGTKGTGSATFRFLFGEDDYFAMVKQSIAFNVYCDIPTSGDSIVVKMALLGSQAFQTVKTLTFDANRLNDRIDRADPPQGLFPNLPAGGSNTYTEDRGLLVRVEMTGPCKVKAIGWKYKDITDEARNP